MKICIVADARTTHVKRWVDFFAKEHEIHLITFSYTLHYINLVFIINECFQKFF